MTSTANHSTEEYVAEHGQAPSGRGGWMIRVNVYAESGVRASEEVSPPYGTLASARAFAVKKVTGSFPNQDIHIETEVMP